VLHSPSLLVTVLAFLLLLGPLVVIHELGHYLVGRLFGVKADTFSVGFGKEMFGFIRATGASHQKKELAATSGDHCAVSNAAQYGYARKISKRV